MEELLMPGSYAHITSVIEASEKRRLKKIDGFPPEAIYAANIHAKFLELGCISPDYPYMHILSEDSKAWADEMHYTHTCKTVSVGAEIVRALPEGLAKEKCLAWFMGYIAHVIADMSVHPVVEIKVGPYKGNEPHHRRCEMHQDAFIFRRIGTTMPQTAYHLRATILKCGDSKAPDQLDSDVKRLWKEILETVHPDLFIEDPPDIDKWHEKCYSILGKLLPTTSRFVGFSRHVCDGLGLKYPTPKEIDMGEYIENLKVPAAESVDKRMHYDDIFDLAIEHIQRTWLNVTRFVYGREDLIAIRGDEWDLDTGRNKSAKDQRLVFWNYA
jgi:hypothetical protein